MQNTIEEKRISWLDRPLVTSIVVNWELVLFGLVLVLGVVSRFWDLGARVMSHDETIHVYHNSWSLFRGQGYRHDPLSHGPLQFHWIALSYFLFGASDVTARIPAVLCSIATIAFAWNYRRYLGRAGAFVAGILLLISPYMLYYGRYVRNESFVALFGIMLLWSILRYLETGQARYAYWMTAVTVLHFTAKETAFIYTAQAILFLGLYFVYQISRRRWPQNHMRFYFVISLIVGLLLVGGAGVLYLSGQEAAVPATPATGEIATSQSYSMDPLLISLGGLGVVALLVGLYFLIRGYGWNELRRVRSFDLLVLLVTFSLPMAAPIPVRALGLNPIDYNNNQTLTITAIFLVVLLLLSIAIGLLWKPRLWLINAAIFYAIFVVFYTTLFTNGFGVITGLVGSLGYWMEQQGVERGSQPWYYYPLIQIPIYEFLPALGSLLALALAAYYRLVRKNVPDMGAEAGQQDGALPGIPEGAAVFSPADDSRPSIDPPPTFSLLGYWSITSLAAFTIAGEKMPWLTVHMALPLILLAGWSLGKLLDSTDWGLLKAWRGWLAVLLLPVFMISALGAAGSLLGAQPPFQGKDLEQLRSTTTFITAFLMAIGSGAGLLYLTRTWPASQLSRVFLLFFFAFLAVLTVRTSVRAAYINYDNATEYLVYAHGAPGVKQALAQIEEISNRTTDGKAIGVGYDNETAYPFFWYLRDYPNARYYGENPTRSLRDLPIILVSDANYNKIEAVVGQAYHRFDYVRLWWPNQDYFGLDRNRLLYAITNPQMRAAIFQVWFNRDYTLYGQATGKDMSLPNWNPGGRMRAYIRKDIVAQLWNYGTAPVAGEVQADPYEGKGIVLSADRIIGSAGTQAGQFQGPRDLEIAPDGSLYVADTNNHRIQHLASDGSVLQVWGSFGDITQGNAQEGTFSQPWGLAVGPDGSVYVADTWNHRIQKFTGEGQFVSMWGYFGQGDAPEAFYGPRDVAVDSQGRVFVTDTGNDRVVVFDSDGNFLTQFGDQGLGAGQFDENVGVSVDMQGQVYVNDTWNQRVQVFTETQGGTFESIQSWDIVGWYGQSLDNKPYLAVDERGRVFVTDPEGYRVLEFTSTGEFVRYWGDFGAGPEGFGLVGSIAVDPDGGVWVTDPGNNRVMHFTLP